MRRPSPAAFVVITLTLAALALRTWRLGDMPLFGDEAYYLQYVDHPAPAYVDHPAGIAVLLWLSTALGGRGEIGVRWLNALLSAACVPLAYTMGRRYVSATGGLIAASAVAFGPVFIVTGRVAFPDSLHAALMLANLLALAPLLDGRDERWRWALFGLTLALLINVKLSSAFYIVALGLYLLIWRRDLLRARGMWRAASIAALGLIPVAGWNATHDWAGVRWAVAQGNAFGLAPLSRGARAHHAWLYHTPPMAFLALLGGAGAALALWQGVRGGLAGAARARDASLGSSDRGDSLVNPLGLRPLRSMTTEVGLVPETRPALLALVGLCAMLPVLLSDANNPRNLVLGLLAWLPLTGLLLISLPRAGARGLAACVALLLGWTAAYGIGTAVEMVNYREELPRSIAARSVTHDAADWQEFCDEFGPAPGALIYAVGYSYAAQVQFYCGVPVHTNVPQLRLWSLPEADDLTIIAVDGHPIERIDALLRADFARVSGPSERAYARKTVYAWEAAGRRAPLEQVLEDLDYLRLMKEIQ